MSVVIENRRSQRRRVFKGATIVPARATPIDCTVRNVSDGGVCLDVTAHAGVPDRFDLLMITDGSAYACRVAWRSESRIGVAFL